jgi:hypothetical protein
MNGLEQWKVFLKSVVLLFIGLFGLALFLAIPVMFLWNWLMPLIFGLPTLDYIESVGILLLIDCFVYTTKMTVTIQQ